MCGEGERERGGENGGEGRRKKGLDSLVIIIEVHVGGNRRDFTSTDLKRVASGGGELCCS